MAVSGRNSSQVNANARNSDFDNQADRRCVALVHKCKGTLPDGRPCDYHYGRGTEEFPPNYSGVVCPKCGAPRQRCPLPAMQGENKCRHHVRHRPVSLYTQLANNLSAEALDEMIDEDDRSLSKEYHLARLVLDKMASMDGVPEADLLEAVRKFMEIAQKRKTIEAEGSTLELKFNDEVANAVRKKLKELISAFNEALKQFVPEEETRMLIMGFVRRVIAPQGSVIPLSAPPRRGRQSDSELNNAADLE